MLYMVLYYNHSTVGTCGKNSSTDHKTPTTCPLNYVLCCVSHLCRELTTLWVARLDNGTELKMTDPKEQQGDIEEEEAEGKERWDGVDCWGRQAECC